MMEQLSTFDKEILLRFFEYNMPMETRHKIMKEFPQIYNRWMGREIVSVIKNDN